MPRVPKSRRFKHRKNHDSAKRLAINKSRGESAPEVQEKPLQSEDGSSQDTGMSCNLSCSGPPTPASAAESVNLADVTDVRSPDPSVILCDNVLSESPVSVSNIFTPGQSSSRLSESSNDPLRLESPATLFLKVSTLDSLSCPPSTDAVSTNRATPDPLLLLDVKSKVEMFLKKNCWCLEDGETLYLLFLSRTEDKMVQRQLSFKRDGSFVFKVHCKVFPIHEYFNKDKVFAAKTLTDTTIVYFVERIIQIMNVVREFEICAGVSDYNNVWAECSDSGVVDTNPYRECRYSETFRSTKCVQLIPPRKWKCDECLKVAKVLKRKHEMKMKRVVHPNTPNMHLTSEQKSAKLDKQGKVIQCTKKQVERLKMQQLLKKKGENEDEEISCNKLNN